VSDAGFDGMAQMVTAALGAVMTRL
jgi:hypothetical protein